EFDGDRGSVWLDGEHEHLPNPTARQFKDGLLNLRIKNYSGLNMVDRRGRALIRQVFPHIDNLFGHWQGLIVYNELDPEDDLSEDNGLVGPDFLHHFPPAPCPPKGRRVSRHVGRPTKKKSTSSANGKGKEMAVASKRRTPMANSDEESSAEADNRSNSGRSHCSREIDDIAPWDSREAPLDNAERQQTSPTPSPLVHNSPRHGGVASPQQQTFLTPSPPVHNPPRHGGVASPQDALVHNVYTSHADIESQALPRFLPKGRAIPPTLEAFLENVGNFNLTEWSGKLVDLGFHSMYELQRVAKLDEEHRVRTLEMLLLPAQMTQLLIVSLATTLGDMPMHNVYESGGSGSAPRADVESQALPRFSPKGRVIPPAMEAFLENVGNFNLTGWSGELVDLGFHSMYEVRRVAKLDDEHLHLYGSLAMNIFLLVAPNDHVWRRARKRLHTENSCVAYDDKKATHREFSAWRREGKRPRAEKSCVAYGEKKTTRRGFRLEEGYTPRIQCGVGRKKATRREFSAWRREGKRSRAKDSCVAYDDKKATHREFMCGVWRKKKRRAEDSCVAYGEKKNDAPRIQCAAENLPQSGKWDFRLIHAMEYRGFLYYWVCALLYELHVYMHQKSRKHVFRLWDSEKHIANVAMGNPLGTVDKVYQQQTSEKSKSPKKVNSDVVGRNGGDCLWKFFIKRSRPNEKSILRW
ncbi:hypothetical protein C8R43DRAFT_965403, partial [Mycena crocata]